MLTHFLLTTCTFAPAHMPLAEKFTVDYYLWSDNGTAGTDDRSDSYDVSTKMN